MFRRVFPVFMLGLGSWAVAQEPVGLSEKDFLDEMPVVLSVSRLPQRLDEAPGAVTVLDRRMIRLSGARDVVDLLRLVPGFRVSNSFEAIAPQGSYHSNSQEDYGSHIQVLVDGRSVYASYYLGSTGNGLQAVALEDIERIEVLRGTNSATYGARAFLGTINIVTRDTVDTMGFHAYAGIGDNGIRDGLVRLGWGDEETRFRVTADQRGDQGLSGAGGADQVKRINVRADLRPSGVDQLELRAGQSLLDAGIGFVGQSGNAQRVRSLDTSFVQLDWRRSLGTDEDLALQLSHTGERIQDIFAYAPIPGLMVDASGRASNDNLMLQHTLRKGADVRLVWGGEIRQERVASRALYDTEAEFVSDFARVFGNAEWRLHKSLLLNAGGMFERSSIGGEHFSPRLMLNWQILPGQTLRSGVSHGTRAPSIYEKYTNTRYYLGGLLLDSTFVARGGVESERILAREVGYLGDFPALGMSLDVRLFDEEVRDYVKAVPYPITPDGVAGNGTAIDFVNGDNFNIRGAEYQLRWRPWQDAQLIWNQSLAENNRAINGVEPPALRSLGLMFMQRLPNGVDLSLIYYEFGSNGFMGGFQSSPAMSRTDLRLAWPLRISGSRGEISFVVQNLGPAYQDFLPDFYFRRQAFVALRLEN